MISDTERREVARRLREYASWDDEEECLVDCTDWGERVLNLLGCVDTEGECYAALADLIEPPTQCPYYHSDRHYCSIHDVPATPQKVAEEMFGKMCHSTKEEADAYDAMLKSKSVELHPVDRDALLALADEMENNTWYETGFDHHIAVRFARRIREALGVSDEPADR